MALAFAVACVASSAALARLPQTDTPPLPLARFALRDDTTAHSIPAPLLWTLLAAIAASCHTRNQALSDCVIASPKSLN